MFMVNKLVEKATNKKPGGNVESLKAENVYPRLAFHYGIPSEAAKLAYDPVQKIVAVSTKNGQIKLLGKDNTQALLESNDVQPSKFLQVWDIDRKTLSYVHDFEKEITSFTIMHQCSFIFIGDSAGNVTVWKLNQDRHIERMKYWIPCSASHGDTDEAAGGTAIMFISPQPTAESKSLDSRRVEDIGRILFIHADGLLSLWDIKESKSIFAAGRTTTQLSSQESKEVISACWACPFGSKVAVGYSTGDIHIYSIPSNSELGNDSSMSKDSYKSQIGHISKLNLGYRVEKVPIASLKWVYSDGKSSRLYAMGASDATPTNLVQVILLNDDAESRTIKIGLQLLEPCLDLEIISCSNEHIKHKHGLLLLIGKSGQMYAYDDHAIEKYLLQFQSKSPPSIPREVMIKLPFSDSSILSAQFITNSSNTIGSEDQDYVSTVKTIPSLLPSESKHSDPPRFTGFARIKNLYITGHSDGTIKFWDVSCPLLIPLLSITQQSEDDSSQTGIAVTAIYYCTESRHLFSGDKSGTVSVIDIEGPSLLYQKQIGTELSADIISSQFAACDFQGFEKKILVLAARDSSTLALEADSGNILSSRVVQPKKPFKALFMQIIVVRSPVQSSLGLRDMEKAPTNLEFEARGDQEIAVASVLLQNERYRHLDSFAQVYDKNLMASEDGLSPRAVPHKEKKKGIFGSVFKDVTGSKTNQGADIIAEDVKAGFGELFTIFSVSNFPADAENTDNAPLENDDQLDIDDIDLDDLDEKPKGNNVMALLNKQKLASKFQSFKGKLKQMTVKNEKHPTEEEPQNGKAEAVDQIKKKYGFSSPNETSVAKMAEAKLAENVKKLQGINLKTAEMQDNARSFSSMAKETLRIVEQKNNANKS
ncbi:hypothetical protein Cgig2_001633 [Carnegiea gigantea]|uniref:Uncharacterized protein n=1 Tax=Carnegiea gigantea TaxID=171969 RepID=A0A9Q1GU44_9CARY|nr:hypothetical protein Cgig2_001633 [Carnegiea gigantea]